MTDVIMPQMGESIAEGTVTKWMKQVGDRVERDEPLFEISTDKVDAEIPAPASGILAEIRVEPGTTVEINTVVGVIAEEGEAPAPAPSTAEGEAPAAETPQAEVTVPAPAAPPAPPPPEPATPAEQGAPAAAEKPRSEMSVDELRRSRSSPVVRKIASDHDVDIRQIQGSGISGRVTKQDILDHIEGPPAIGEPPRAEPEAAPPAAEPRPPEPPPAAAPAARAAGERVELVPMSPIRKKTAEHMILSKQTSAHVATVFEIDMTRVAQLRHKHGRSFEERSGVKLTYMPFILKATVDALKAFPVLNSSVEGDAIAYRKDVNLGIAVALGWGLIVPVIRNAEERNLLGFARAVNDLAERARTKKLKVEEVQGGTFTITNPGVFGSLFGTPIINQPQVAILGVGTIEKRPVIRDDAIAIRTMAYFALSFDHRVVDGADADRFMAHIKQGLQEFDETAL